MTKFETLTIILSFLAVAISFIVYLSQRKLQREANDLQRTMTELATKQLLLIEQEEKKKEETRLSLTLRRDGSTHYFCLKNIGNADAQDVDFKFLLNDSDENPLINAEYNEKFPVKRLIPNAEVKLIAALDGDTPFVFPSIISWTNLSGERIEEKTHISL